MPAVVVPFDRQTSARRSTGHAAAQPQPSEGPTRSLVVARMIRWIDRLDDEQIQIVELIIAAMLRGGRAS